MNEEDIVSSNVSSDLASSLHKRLRLNIANGSANLGDDYIRSGHHGGLQSHAALELISDVRDNLHGIAQVLATPLLGNHGGVSLAGCDVRGRVQVDI